VYPHDRWLFLTWHLHGSLPRGHGSTDNSTRLDVGLSFCARMKSPKASAIPWSAANHVHILLVPLIEDYRWSSAKRVARSGDAAR
jgi:hypothetical protein